MNRGIAPTETWHYLNTTSNDLLDPTTIDNLVRGAKLLISHIAKQNKIFIQIDEDCDGYTSAALLLNYLNSIFPYYTQNFISYSAHQQKEHGIDLDAIPSDASLVIVPDAGSNEFDKHEILAQKGIDILIIDHHNAERFSDYACVVNNQLCEYPTKSLSGVGMVYKFCSYLDQELGTNHVERLQDLVAIGCVADMMELRDFETKHLVTEGLAHPENPFIKGMMVKNDFQLKGELTPFGVSWFIAPAVNAVTRVGTYEERMVMFEAMLDFHAYDEIPSTKRGCKGQLETKVEQACRNCTNVRNRQNKERDEGLDYIDELIQEQGMFDDPLLLILLERDDFNPNIIGLMANQVAAKYNKPTLILRAVKDEDGQTYWRGSGRNIKGTEFESLQAYLLSTGLVEYAQGHDNALGVSIPAQNIEAFRLQINTDLRRYDFSPIYSVDLEFDASKINGQDVLSLGDLYPIWGQGIEEPWIMVKNIKVNKSNLYFMKNNTIKIAPIEREDRLSYIMFKASDTTMNLLEPGDGYVVLNIIGHCTRNNYGEISPQIVIKDYEIVSRSAYYF